MSTRYTDGLVTIKIEAKTRRVVYCYQAGEMGFEFDTFNEIGEPYQAGFKKLIARYRLQVELYDNPADTYCHGFYERLIANTLCCLEEVTQSI